VHKTPKETYMFLNFYVLTVT